jgi:hypothetical protein
MGSADAPDFSEPQSVQQNRIGPYFTVLLKGLESENAKLKKLLADTMLDNAALKDLLAKKW